MRLACVKNACGILNAMQTTSIRVAPDNRDALAHIARDELGGVSLDEALRVLLFQHQTVVALNHLAEDPQALAGYRAEAQELAETDVAVQDW